MWRNESRAISRRAFVGLAAAGGAGLAFGARSAAASTRSSNESDRHGHHGDDEFIEATIPELQRLMRRHRLTSRELTDAYLDRIEQLNPLARRGDRGQPRRAADRPPARPRASLRPRPRPAARHPGADQGQHRHRRPHADDGRLARARRERRSPGDVAGRGAAARRGRGDPRQGQPVGVGQLPRLRAVQRLDGARRVHPRPVPARPPIRAARARGRRSRPPPTSAAVAVGTETDGSIVCPSGNNLHRRHQAADRHGRRATASSPSPTARTRRGR